MAIYPIQKFQDLVNAITNASDGDEISITADTIVLAAALPVITKNLTFTSVGQNATISGDNKYRVFQVAGSANVTFTNLTIANGLAKGADGVFNSNTTGNTTGGNGLAGLGGGLFLDGGTVTLINTTFQNNRAEGGAGGGSARGTGGNGGIGQGGAVFVNQGTLRINNTVFGSSDVAAKGNTAAAGTKGTGGTAAGQDGVSQGGAIYINQGSVIAEGEPRFGNNLAVQGINTFGPGVYQVLPRPFVQSIARANPNPTAQTSLDYTVQFNQDVTGVDLSDFRLVATGDLTGTGVVSVTPNPGGSRTYTVRVNAGIGNEGTVELRLEDNDSIQTGGVPLGGTGQGNGSLAGQIYSINRKPPTADIARKNNAPEGTAADEVTYSVFFNESVSGIDVSDFQVIADSTISGAQVVAVTPRSAAAYDVRVNTGDGNGNIQLRLLDDDTVKNGRGVPLGGSGVGNGTVLSELYKINKTPPTVSAINQLGNSPTGDATIRFRVAFDQAVTGVTNDDFAAAASGVSGANVASVTAIDAQTYDVVLNTGSGDGTLGLNLVDNDSIRNGLGVALGGSGLGNGNKTGTPYTVIKSAPLVSAISLASANPTAAGTASFLVTFNQTVTGVTRDDFRAFGTGLTGFGVSEVSGSGQSYTVVVNTGSGSGRLGLNLVDNDTIVNNIKAPLGGRGTGNGNFTGQTYTINKTPPRVTAINRLESSATNAATVNFTVSFNEAVSRVDPTDFALATQGVSGAGITSVVRVNDSFYSVAVNTGSGEGTVGLNLISNPTILNGLGIPVQAGFNGEVYSIDRTAPTADIIDVAPDPRQDKVEAITIRFNEAVKGLDLADLQLTQSGSPVALNRATLTSADGITWTLGNLRKLTNDRGDYSLLLAASGSAVTDAAGNPLVTNATDRWTNLVNVEACEPGITRRGTRGTNRLQGTEDNDVMLGLAGNDLLIGLDCRDRLNGGKGNDRLIGGEGSDLLIGGTGADRFVYSSFSQATALADSLAEAPDRIQKFRFSEADKFQLDFDGNLGREDRPRGLFNAGRVRGQSLEQATRNAYKNKNQSARGSESLEGNEAVFFGWRGGTYLSVNDRSQNFAATRDLVVNVSGIQFKSGDTNSGSLSVANYFA